jgi:hypothetical protein
MTATTVVNLRHEPCDVKICRKKDGTIPEPPEHGCFGNPFRLRKENDDAERESVCDMFELYFLGKIVEPVFRTAVLSLKGKTLGCFCKPKRCHGDTIALYLQVSDEIEKYVEKYGEKARRLLTSSLMFAAEREPKWDVKLDYDDYIANIMEKIVFD